MLNYLASLPGAIAQGLIWGIMAIGVYITYRVLDFADLTVDGSICTGAAVCTVLMTKGANVWIALAAAFATGMLAGLVTGLLHTLMGIPPILSGILTQLMLWSVFGTEIGAALRATGCSLHMSRAQGINTNRATVLGLVISNGIVALSGAFLAQFLGNADINMGRGAIVIGLAAVIIGGAVFSRICGNFAFRLLSVILGGVIYYLVYQTVIYLGLDTDLLKLLSALVVAVFLAIPYWNRKLHGRFGGKRIRGGDRNA